MKTREKELLIVSVVVDLLLLNGMYLLLYFTVFHSYAFNDAGVVAAGLLLNGSRIFSYLVVRKHIIYHKKGFRPRLYMMLLRSFFFALPVVALPQVVAFPFDMPHSVMLYVSAVLFLFTKFAFNYCYYSLVKRTIQYSSRAKKVVLLGNNDEMTRIHQLITLNPVLNYRYLMHYDKSLPDNSDDSYEELSQLVLEQNIQVMFVAVDRVDSPYSDCFEMKELLRHCSRWGVRLFLVPREEPAKVDELTMDRIKDVLIYNPQRIPLDIAENQIKKRLFDIAFSIVFVVLVASWLFPLLAVLVKLSSRGPVFFIQKRTGINNRTFHCLKFRSMRVNGDAHKKQATKNDPRITRIGRFMRRTNFDELPQFLNVLWGDMSVVGPRPHMLAHTELFSREVENYLVRHYVKPGITGWAQVNGFRGETHELWQIEKRVEYDREYIRNWSFEWDLLIVWKTIFSVKAFNNAG